MQTHHDKTEAVAAASACTVASSPSRRSASSIGHKTMHIQSGTGSWQRIPVHDMILDRDEGDPKSRSGASQRVAGTRQARETSAARL